MRISNDFTPGLRDYDADPTGASAPHIWYGQEALDATRAPWSLVGIGSIYICNAPGSVAHYVKTAHAESASDWRQVLAQEASGDVTITGTLTVGDVNMVAE